MKVLKSVAAVFLALLASVANAERGTIRSMAEILPLVDQETLLVFDIDNTTLRPTQTLGSDQFFRYLKKQAQERGMAEADAVAWTLAQVTPIQPRSPVVPVEEITPGLIRDFQARGIVLFALTARPQAWRQQTTAQLRSIAVDFSPTAPALAEIENGIHFQLPGKEKGSELVEVIRRLPKRPTRVVFVDDRDSNVESVAKALDATEIPHYSLRYVAADDWVNSFDARIAELQFKIFKEEGRFLSDDEARRMIEARNVLPFPFKNGIEAANSRLGESASPVALKRSGPRL